MTPSSSPLDHDDEELEAPDIEMERGLDVLAPERGGSESHDVPSAGSTREALDAPDAESDDPELAEMAAAMERELGASALKSSDGEVRARKKQTVNTTLPDLFSQRDVPDPMRWHRWTVGAYVALIGFALGGFVSLMVWSGRGFSVMS